MANDHALKISGLSKRFGGALALDGVDLVIPRHSVHGLIGTNGSGKSTLVKILTGYHAPDQGTIEVWGERARHRVGQPVAAGIATIHQDLGLIGSMSVLENVIQPLRFNARGIRPIRWKQQRRHVQDLLEELVIDVDPDNLVEKMGRGEQTLIAVARAVAELRWSAHGRGERPGDLLIMDEPTAALNEAEATRVHELLRRVAAGGGAALLVSHHLHEIRTVCDEVTVLRDGRRITTTLTSLASQDALVTAMIGEEASSHVRAHASREPVLRSTGVRPVQDAVLEARSLHGAGVTDVSLSVAAGEILGITGMLGQGQRELVDMLAGVLRPASGSVYVDGRELRPGSILSALGAGVVLVPAERRRDGLWMAATVAENLGLQHALGGLFYSRSGERSRAAILCSKYGIKPPDPIALVSTLSGGNQQKVLVAKCLSRAPRAVLMHEPTQGVDIAAKLAIHDTIREFAETTRAAVCVVSSDQREVVDLCDRVLVMVRGRVVASASDEELSIQHVARLSHQGTLQ